MYIHCCTLRPYTPSDLHDVLSLFYETVHTVNIRDYTQAEVNAWAPSCPDRRAWQNRLCRQDTLLVETNNHLTAFANWNRIDHLDCLYVHKNWQRCGMATILLNEIERRAKECFSPHLYTEASITASPFFRSAAISCKNSKSYYAKVCE